MTRRRHRRSRQTIALVRLPSLTFQLRDVDAALLGDRLGRSREIGVMQQVLVAHLADGGPRGLRQIEDERMPIQ